MLSPLQISDPTKGVKNERESLLLRIKGLNITIPDLKPIFHDWTGISSLKISPWLDLLREKVQDRLEILGHDQSKLQRLEAADFALFTALWWPNAPSLAHLEVLAYLVIWLFTWDDEIDEPTGLYTDDAASAQNYRVHTLAFVGACLGLPGFSPSFKPHSRTVQSFDVIGLALAANYDESQRQRFFDEIARFMIASEEEQTCRLQGRVFTLEEYWPVRLGTSAVYIGSAAGEFSMGSSSPLPSDLMQCAAMRALWDETNIIISITNDLLSLRKEMRFDCIDSIVPLTFASTCDIHMALDLSIKALRASKTRFDEAAKTLLKEACYGKKSEEVTKQLEQFIEVQRSNCVGNLVWSLRTRRYNETDLLVEDGSQTFTL
ncbi:hypothetical protein N0V93_002204 [Gnomoniopsis smithogilvyi]|uniref:Terpene synthase n=1 Tax=Gnomoniopsis smithogilvyi TaxID=1191159 RepID=A0A9W8YUD0_9PEZI|nr:hypothetical protein N0V93_002204 [Gnomoniopsis smithogilvyi]